MAICHVQFLYSISSLKKKKKKKKKKSLSTQELNLKYQVYGFKESTIKLPKFRQLYFFIMFILYQSIRAIYGLYIIHMIGWSGPTLVVSQWLPVHSSDLIYAQSVRI